MLDEVQTADTQGQTPEPVSEFTAPEVAPDATPAAPEQAPAPEAGAPGSWLDSVPDQLRGELAGFDSPEQAMESLQATKERLGTVPDAATGYDLNIPEGIGMDGGTKDAFLEHCHQNNVPTHVAQQMVDFQATKTEEARTQQAQQVQAWADDAFKSAEFGNGDKALFDEKVGKATAAFERFAADGLGEMLDASGYGNQEAVLRTFLNIAEAMNMEAPLAEGKNTSATQSLAERIYGSETGE